MKKEKFKVGDRVNVEVKILVIDTVDDEHFFVTKGRYGFWCRVSELTKIRR